MSLVTTAVLPVAGLGTRFLPITKSGPKEMLPIVDKPVIQYAVEEAIAAGINHLVFITSNGKRAIEDYFDRNLELETHLAKKNDFEMLTVVKNILPANVNITYVRQSTPLGLGHAILCAKHVVGNQPFAVLLPDDIIDASPKSCLEQLIEIYADTQSSVIAVEKVPLADVHKYGIVSIKNNANNKHNHAHSSYTKYPLIEQIVEKPHYTQAPSQLAVTGRYILSANIFTHLEAIEQGAAGEQQLTDAIAKLLEHEPVIAHLFSGKRYDCGNPLGLLKATMIFALRRAELSAQVADFITELAVASIGSDSKLLGRHPGILRSNISEIYTNNFESLPKDQ